MEELIYWQPSVFDSVGFVGFGGGGKVVVNGAGMRRTGP